jgi:hypothetical protein
MRAKLERHKVERIYRIAPLPPLAGPAAGRKPKMQSLHSVLLAFASPFLDCCRRKRHLPAKKEEEPRAYAARPGGNSLWRIVWSDSKLLDLPQSSAA